ncbi:MAG: hypothetical protein LBE13_12390 [Bacteroidales bacterium]|jgi:hypothetical protein|nr:hypothetical protein [Bacteroidales bacterium]
MAKERKILFCEGSVQSCDIRILKKLLKLTCQVVAGGSTRGLRKRVDLARQIYGAESVYVIRDRDFPEKWTGMPQKILNWITPDHLGVVKQWGWLWARREIENYLIDPIIVQKSLDVHGQQKISDIRHFNLDEYIAALNSARDSIMIYQAARIALTQAGKPCYLRTNFGKARGKYNYRFPQKRDMLSCEQEIKKLFQNQSQRAVTINEVLGNFHRIFEEECSFGKPRYNDYLYAFSGKDILWAMEEWFSKTSFQNNITFQEIILTGIENSSKDIATWCNEWQYLFDVLCEID